MAKNQIGSDKMNLRECAVCGSKASRLLFKQSFTNMSDVNLVDGYDVVVCTDCGFCFADKIPGQDNFDNYYRDMSKYEKPDLNARESPYDIKRFTLTGNYITKVIQEKQTKIVEVGCATGLLLSHLKSIGYDDLLGVDPSPACVETTILLHGIQAKTGTLDNLPINNESIDCIILIGVLEHIRDLNGSLHNLYNLLKSGGKLIIGVPDASQYYIGNDAPFQEFSLEHINFFGPDSLINLMNKNDFALLDMESKLYEVNHNTFTPVILSTYIKEPENKTKAITEDVKTVDNLEKYIQKSINTDKILNEKISRVVDNGHPFIIWGTGAQALRLLSNSKLGQANIKSFVDSNPKYQGHTLNGVTIVPPEKLKEMKEPILILTWAYQTEIEFQIREVLKLENEIIKIY